MPAAHPRHPACSTSAVRAPHRAAATAAATPALPPPTTMTSKMSCLLIAMCSCSPARLCLPPTGDGRLHHVDIAHLLSAFLRPISRGGVPDRTRTCDPRFRKPMLYPAELRGRYILYQLLSFTAS